MRFGKRHRGHAFRVLALLLAAFEVLASARALVPNLCLTLRAAAEAPACDGSAAQHSCCAPQGRSPEGSTPAAPGKDNPKCPFCFLAKACTEAPFNFEHPRWQQRADAPVDAGAGNPYLRPIPSPALGRAPPCPFA